MGFIPVSDILKENDYLVPFQFDYSHYSQVCGARKEMGLSTREDYKENYDSRCGHYITGEEIKTQPHTYHEMWLVNTLNNKRYHIDIVSIQHHFGKYVALVVRREGSESHGVKYFENITCHCPTVCKSIDENRKIYKLIKK